MQEPRSLPPAWLDEPSAWLGPAMARRRDWIVTLAAEEIGELEAAVRPLAAAERDIASLRREDFPLPRLESRLCAVLEEVLTGRGFALLRGLPVARWSLRESAIAFYGLGLHFGNPRAQNAAGDLIGHVTDLGRDSADPTVRIYQTRERQTFHTDSCDLVALLCLRPAKSGGLSALVSAASLYNAFRRCRPDLVEELFRPVATDRRGEVAPGQKPVFEIPVLNWFAGRLSVIYQRQYVESAQRFAEAPRLTVRQREALDLFDALADDPALHFTMALAPGDVQLLCNHSLLHDRTAFEDWPEPERRRHLLRLWLAPLSARPLPEVFAQRFGSVVPGARGGVQAGESRARVCLAPEIQSPWRMC